MFQNGKTSGTTPKGNMGYDQYTVPNDCSSRTYFCCFTLALANICPWALVPFFQISLENRADKTTHNTFRDCRVHFSRQPLLKQLYINTWRVCQTRDHTSLIGTLPDTLSFSLTGIRLSPKQARRVRNG